MTESGDVPEQPTDSKDEPLEPRPDEEPAGWEPSNLELFEIRESQDEIEERGGDNE